MIKFIEYIFRSDSKNMIMLSLCFLFSAFYFLSDIGQQSITYSDEATHVRVIQEMLESGNYLNPTLDGKAYLNKPPLKMWLSVALIKIFGESNFTFRFIDGLCSAGIVTLVLLLGLNIFKARFPACMAAFSLLGSEGFFVTARQNTATQDAFVVFCNTLAITVAYFLLTQSKKNKSLVLASVFGLSLAAGVLTKSIVGIVPLLIVLPVIFICQKSVLRDFRNKTQVLTVILAVFLTPVVAYYSYLIINIPDAWSRVFGYDIKQRLITEGFHNPEYWWFYLQRLFVDGDLFPVWILSLSLCSITLFIALKKDFSSTLIFCWAFIPLIIFSCLQSRAFHYIAPAFPALALGVGQLFLFNANRVAKFFLLTVFLSLSLNFYHSSKRLFREEKKLPVEWLSLELKQLPEIKNVHEYNLQNYLDGDTYQRWRQEFYLDIISKNRVQLKEDKILADNSLLLTDWKSALELLSDRKIRDRACGYWPLLKPLSKRQVLSDKRLNKPEALAILFTECSKVPEAAVHFVSLRKIINPKISGLTGFEKNQVISSTFSFKLEASPLLKSFPAKLRIRAAVKPVLEDFRAEKIGVMLNGASLPAVEIAGGLSRDYVIDIASYHWIDGENLLSFHQLNEKHAARIVLDHLRLDID